jgi:rRNA maturation endonuclease Nob1
MPEVSKVLMVQKPDLPGPVVIMKRCSYCDSKYPTPKFKKCPYCGSTKVTR